jgi:hypothetical protein
VLPECLAHGGPVVGAETNCDRGDDRDAAGHDSPDGEKDQRDGCCGETRRRELGHEIRRERRVHVDETQVVKNRRGNRCDQRRWQRVRRSKVTLPIAAECRALRQRGTLRDDSIQRQRPGDRNFARRELGGLRIDRTDLAAVRVVNHDKAGKKNGSGEPRGVVQRCRSHRRGWP